MSRFARSFRTTSGQPIMYRCWPKEWRDAAIEADLAYATDFGCVFHDGDVMRDKLEVFAAVLLAKYEKPDA